jgi:uncharacterized membrane protein required for colicin V production
LAGIIVAAFFSSFNSRKADSADTAKDFRPRKPGERRIYEKGTMPRQWREGAHMGLDVALGIIILIAAIRGWLQGFVHQTVRIAGLIACVYLADPVRDNAKPYVLPYLPTIQPDLVDRLLWWVSAGIAYVLLVGLSTLVIKMTRRPEIPGISQSGRHDQSAGFLLGTAKGVLIATFLVAGIQRYALKQVTTIAWANEQVKTSWALRWSEQYRPAAKVWSSVPVQHFVNHIQRRGLQNPAEAMPVHTDGKTGDRSVVQTASRPPALEVEGLPRAIDSEVERAVEEIKATLDAAAKPSN